MTAAACARTRIYLEDREVENAMVADDEEGFVLQVVIEPEGHVASDIRRKPDPAQGEELLDPLNMFGASTSGFNLIVRRLHGHVEIVRT